MDLDNILQNLKTLGFTEYEGKVYLSLLNHHPASASTISNHSGVPHSRVYDVTKRLIKKGYAVSQGKGPEIYSPVAPEELIRSIKRDNKKVIRALKIQLDSISFESPFDPVWNLSRKTDAVEISLELVESAKEEIFIGLWDEELDLFEDALRACYENGIKIYILIYGSRKLDFGEVFYHSIENIEGRKTYGTTLDLVVDSSVCVTGHLGNSAACEAVWTRNKGLIKSIEGYLIHDLFIAEIGKRFGNEIDKTFGHNLEKLRQKYGH